MTVASELARNEYNGDDIAVDFTVGFYFLINADVRAVLYNSVTEVETELVEVTHYTLVGAGEAAGGTLTMIAAPTSDETITLLRELALTQERDYIEHSNFPAESHEQAIDRLTMLQQQLNEKFIRTVRFQPSATKKNIKMENLTANKVLLVNPTADKMIMGPNGNEIESAQTYATAAEIARTAAELAETHAETAETNAVTAKTAAETAQTAAELAETNAVTAKTAAELAETNAVTAKTAAELAETNAVTAKTAAETAETNAVTAYDDFDDRYLGAKASDPSLDNDGNALITGALYFNTTTNHMRVYDGAAWGDIVSDVTAAANITDEALVLGDGGAKGIKALALGAADLKLFMNAAGNALEWASGVKIGLTTWDTANATGTQEITGVGFKPSAVLVLASVISTSQASIGLSNGSLDYCIYNAHSDGADQWGYDTAVIHLRQAAAIYTQSDITALGADGFTFTHTKGGAKTGIANIIYKAFR